MSKALKKIVSPKGEFRWVTITGEGVENMSGKLQYKVDLVLDPKNVKADKAFIDSIDAFWAENKPAGFKKKPKSLGYYFCDKVLDKDGNPIKDDEDMFVYDKEGKVSVSFKTSTIWPDGKVKVVKTRNAKGKEVNLGETMIGNGSIGYAAGAMDIYVQDVKNVIQSAGVTFYLDELKIVKLEVFEGTSQLANEDEEDEGGWTGEDEDAFVGTEESAKPRL